MPVREGLVSTCLERYIDDEFKGSVRSFVREFNEGGYEHQLTKTELDDLLYDDAEAPDRLQKDIAHFVGARRYNVFLANGQLKCRNGFW